MIRGYRTMRWINTETLKEFWGIQAKHSEYGWMHCAENGEPLFFATEDEARAKMLTLD